MRNFDPFVERWEREEVDDCTVIMRGVTRPVDGKQPWVKWISCDGASWRFLSVSNLRWHDGTPIRTAGGMIGWLRMNEGH